MPEKIRLTAADGHEFDAWSVVNGDPSIGLVVVQEIFGVNAQIRRVCEQFAQATAYAIIAPALFDRVERGVELGYTASDVARGRALRAKLKEQDILADLTAAAAAAGNGRRKVGIVGFCFGGFVSWLGATGTDNFAAASCWYGGGMAARRDAKPRCPVQMHFGESDASIPMSDVALIRAAQPAAEIFTYPKAQHGFSCDDRASYDAAATKLARERTFAFFAKHLGKVSVRI